MYKTSDELSKKIQSFFRAKIFGSRILKDLKLNELSDIDIAVHVDDIPSVRTFLQDFGYKDERKQHYTNEGYKSFFGDSQYFEKAGQIPIDIRIVESKDWAKFEVWKEWEIIGKKFMRGYANDKVQLQLILNRRK